MLCKEDNNLIRSDTSPSRHIAIDDYLNERAHHQVQVKTRHVRGQITNNELKKVE